MKYLVVICTEVNMRSKCYAKISELNFHLSHDSSSQLKTNICLITITKLRLRVVGYNRISRN